MKHVYVYLSLVASPASCFISISVDGVARKKLPITLQTRPPPSLYLRRHQLLQSRNVVMNVSMNAHESIIESEDKQQSGLSLSDISKNVCRLSPLWTILSACIAMEYPLLIGSTVGSLSVMQTALSILMLAMGLTITTGDISRAIQKPYVIILNILLCFGMMPVLAMI